MKKHLSGIPVSPKPNHFRRKFPNEWSGPTLLALAGNIARASKVGPDHSFA